MGGEAMAEFFGQLSTSTFVVGVAHESEYDIFAAASVMLASRRPPLLAVCINRRHSAYPIMRAGRLFSVSVMKKLPPELAHRMRMKPSRNPDSVDGVSWTKNKDGVPLPDDGVIASFECEMNAMVAAGDHEIMLGRVLSSRLPEKAGRQLPRQSFPERRMHDRQIAQSMRPT